AGIADDDLQQREPNFLGDVDHATTRRQQGGIELKRSASAANVLIAGVDLEREAVSALSYGTRVDTVGDNRAVYLHDDFTQGRHQLGLGVRHAVYDSFGEHWTGDANYGLRIGADTWGWLAYGRGFRAPDAMELFGYGGNPALKPETTASSEIGLRQRVGAHEFTLTGYQQRIDELIDFPAPTYTAVNIARAHITGTELGWSWRNATTQLDAFVTLADPVDETTGERLSRRPQKQLSAAARHRTGAIEWRSAVLAMDRRDNSAYDTLVLPGFGVLDIGAAWTVRPGLVVDGRVENIGDRDYALATGSTGDYRMPDRAFYLGVDWRH
ncbi:MAG: TonB-dependent receptor, partial [Actinomycetota bacterium]|nr:TonB-dependent receptor [Actinomycetota bacterium]